MEPSPFPSRGVLLSAAVLLFPHAYVPFVKLAVISRALLLHVVMARPPHGDDALSPSLFPKLALIRSLVANMPSELVWPYRPSSSVFSPMDFCSSRNAVRASETDSKMMSSDHCPWINIECLRHSNVEQVPVLHDRLKLESCICQHRYSTCGKGCRRHLLHSHLRISFRRPYRVSAAAEAIGEKHRRRWVYYGQTNSDGMLATRGADQC